ncbi:MAG: metallophosphoesterase [Chitinispirillaceae bacterium]|nr:metallophosphoesterase [Chitinispirillaceae bacterium]
MCRLIAVGDMQGHWAELDNLLNQIQPTCDDQFVFLGDYIDWF